MLLASALYRLLSVCAGGSLSNLAADAIKTDVPIVLAQVLGRVLCGQRDNGSWGDSVERTSYAALLMPYALKLPWPLTIRQHVENAFFKAKTYLAAHFDERATGDCLWIEKATYKLPTLAEAYCLAALNSSATVQS